MRDLPDAKYGENKAYQEQQQGAPLAKAPDFSDMAAPPMGPAPSPGGGSITGPDQRVGFTDPSARPEEHIMSGAPFGAGRNSDYVAGPGQANVQAGQLSAALTQHFAEDPTGILRLLASDLAEMGV